MMVVHDSAENYTYQRLITKLAENARLPAIYPQSPVLSNLAVLCRTGLNW